MVVWGVGLLGREMAFEVGSRWRGYWLKMSRLDILACCLVLSSFVKYLFGS